MQRDFLADGERSARADWRLERGRGCKSLLCRRMDEFDGVWSGEPDVGAGGQFGGRRARKGERRPVWTHRRARKEERRVVWAERRARKEWRTPICPRRRPVCRERSVRGGKIGLRCAEDGLRFPRTGPASSKTALRTRKTGLRFPRSDCRFPRAARRWGGKVAEQEASGGSRRCAGQPGRVRRRISLSTFPAPQGSPRACGAGSFRRRRACFPFAASAG